VEDGGGRGSIKGRMAAGSAVKVKRASEKIGQKTESINNGLQGGVCRGERLLKKGKGPTVLGDISGGGRESHYNKETRKLTPTEKLGADWAIGTSKTGYLGII